MGFAYRFVFSFTILIFTSLVGQSYCYSKNHEDSLYFSIQKGDIKTLSRILSPLNVNQPFEKDSLVPLVLAIKANRPKAVKYLLSIKADPNIRCKGVTPLMYACGENSKMQIRLLLKYGANVNEIDAEGNTVLMIAAASQPHGIIRLLLKHGASLNVRNYQGLRASDIANCTNNKSALNYLRTMFERHLPDYFDGPYVFYRCARKVEVSYLKHDSLKQRTNKYNCVYKLKDLQVFNRVTGEGTAFELIKTKFDRESSTVTGIEKIFVIGDIHGQYDTLKKFLVNNHIIDKHLNWSFGNGHLVFLGDIFDRGEQVTDVLWLIYHLENEAALSGGRVHLLLGNHETMILSNDTRYLADKYYYLFDKLHLDYHKWYGDKTLIGRWLRAKNMMLKINDVLFVHAGIHPDLLKYNVSIDSVNQIMYNYLNGKIKSENSLLNFLLEDKGPLWYRGMIALDSPEDRISENDVNLILAHFNANKIMVGHTNQPHITSYYSGKIFGLDVPFYYWQGPQMEAMYIDSSGFYRAFTNGEKKKIQ